MCIRHLVPLELTMLIRCPVLSINNQLEMSQLLDILNLIVEIGKQLLMLMEILKVVQ